jgi:predicted ATPase/DNA-binding SARP family transcriptional activator
MRGAELNPSGSPPTLALYLLGSPQIERDGRAVSVDTRKAIALLAYLAVTGEAHSREALAALLWPEYSQERALANLRRTLYSLNKAVGREWLDAGQDSIGLRREAGYWLDVDAFHQHLAGCQAHDHAASEACPDCLSELGAAAAFYRGDFMAGFGLRDSPAFEEWQFFEGESLRREMASALERLIQVHARATPPDLEPAIDCARRWLALDPLHEPAHRQLMALYACAGRRAAALRQYQECARILEEEVGIEPEGETTDLYEAIQAGQLPGPDAPAGPALQVPAEGTAPIGTGPAPALHLPLQPTPFVGRQRELAEIAGLLRDPGCRLLTLVGPGGIGKTRLAIEAAAGQTAAFPDGIYFVPLAPLSSAEFLVSAMADVLHFAFFQRKDEDPRRQLLNYLREKRLLLVLDNFEHLVEGAGQLAEMLQEAPGLRLLVTSRARLNLRGEWVMEVGGMRFPTGSEAPSVDEHSAMRLFLQTAQRVDVGFELKPEAISDVARICQLVEGMPLGLELAATWVKLLSCREIADEIGRGLDFMTSSVRDVPDRHRSLRAVFGHSWQLLDEEERRTFARLSVFCGGFRREAARQVADASLPLLSALVDKSLLRRGPGARYDMHPLLKEYAAEKLDAMPGEWISARDRHSRYFATFLHEQGRLLTGADQKAAIDEIVRELENVRAAWQWATARGQVTEMAPAMRSLQRFYDVQSRFQEGEEAFHLAVTALEARQAEVGHEDEETSAALGLALAYQSWFANRLYRPDQARELALRGLVVLQPVGRRWETAEVTRMAIEADAFDDLEAAERAIEESASIYREAGDRSGLAVVELISSTVARYEHHHPGEVERRLQKALAIFAEIGDRWGMAYALFDLGDLVQSLGNRQAALDYYGRSLETRREIGDRWGMALCLDYMGYLARELGDDQRARALHEESLAISREIGDRLGIAGSINNLGLVAFERGEIEEAQRLLEEGMAIRLGVGRSWDIAASAPHLGDLALAQGRFQEAAAHYQTSLEVGRRINWPWAVVMGNRGLGEVALARSDLEAARHYLYAALSEAIDFQDISLAPDVLVGAARFWIESGRPERAVELLASIREDPTSRHLMRLRAEGMLAELEARLSTDEFVRARERATGKRLADVVDEVRAGLGPGRNER